MAIPPPPPPGPPPPPAFKLGGGGGGGSGALNLGGGSNSGDSRNALLLSIQKGAKLKKTVTNDKSGPAIAGRVAGATPSGNSSNGERRPGGPGGGGGGGGGGGAPVGNGGAPKLAGIFGGMSEMPKLKPVNRGGGNQSTLNRSPPKTSPVESQNTSISSSNSSSSVNNSSSISSSNGPLDFNAELTQHLTLKKKKLQEQKQSPPPPAQGSNVTEANLKTNRGPPPQPPPVPKNPPTPPPPINGIAANSSSLFPNSNGATKSQPVPRSPPVAPPVPGAPVFPSQNNFGTMRNPSQYQSQETISSNSPAPVNGRQIGRPTVAPPRPPPNKPPPPPLRSVSNQNLPQMPLSTPTTNTLNSAASANNVSALKEQLKHQILPGQTGGSTPSVDKVAAQHSAGNGVAPPPLPPHRTCPAPPPPNANRQVSNTSTSSQVPPVPPQRHSSIRSVSVTDSAPLSKPLPPTTNGGMSAINRIIVDLETKFADRFHNPTEFPKPPPFFKTEKHYPSLSRAKNGICNRKY